MSIPCELKPFDPCPGCGGQLRKAQQPTAAERAKATPGPDAIPLPPHYDTAPADVVAEFGELWRCPFCGYPHRFKPAADAPAA